MAWLTAPRVGGGDQGIWSLVPRRVELCLLGLATAVLAACAWQARRLGRPVLESPVVAIPGSELVLATGRLLAWNRHYEEAAALMRDDLCKQLCSRFAQAPGTDRATVAQVVALRTGLARDEVLAALGGPPPRSEEELLGLACSLQRIREEVLSGTKTVS